MRTARQDLGWVRPLCLLSRGRTQITQVAALNGATAALDYGISAIGGPVVWVAKLALYAGSCALSEQL